MKKRSFILFLLILTGVSCFSCSNKDTPPKTSSSSSEVNWEVIKEATCVEDGIKRTLIKGEYVEETIPALGHDYGDWTTINEPTCEDMGYKIRTCNRCEDEESETIPEIGHVVVDKFYYDKDNHYFKCSTCGEEFDKIAHDFELQKEETLTIPYYFTGSNATVSSYFLLWQSLNLPLKATNGVSIKINNNQINNQLSISDYSNLATTSYVEDESNIEYGTASYYQCKGCEAEVVVKELQQSEVLPENEYPNLFPYSEMKEFEYDENGNLIYYHSCSFSESYSLTNYKYDEITRYYEYDEMNRVKTIINNPNYTTRIGVYYDDTYEDETYDYCLKQEYYNSSTQEWLVTDSSEKLYVQLDELNRPYFGLHVFFDSRDNLLTHSSIEIEYYEDTSNVSMYSETYTVYQNGEFVSESLLFKYNFDEYQNIIRYESHKSSSDMINVYNNTYDSYGRIASREIIWDASQKKDYDNISFAYQTDNDGNVIEISVYKEVKKSYFSYSDEYLTIITLSYDNEGKLISLHENNMNKTSEKTEYGQSTIKDIIYEYGYITDY